MSKGYTSVADVQRQLGRTLTADQIIHFNGVILPAVESWIDNTGGRAYGESVVVGESLIMGGPYTWLAKAPVSAITELRGTYYGQATPTTDVYYRLMDANTGYIWIPYWTSYETLVVDYTPDADIPSNIKLASAMVAGVFMRTVLHPQTEWQTEYASAQDIRLKFRDVVVPDIVYQLVGSDGSITVA